MNRLCSGTLISWRTRNARKMKYMETWCADYGLKQIHKTFHVGSLYERERRSFEQKVKTLLSSKHDQYSMIVLCASCRKDLAVSHEIAETKTPYEIF